MTSITPGREAPDEAPPPEPVLHVAAPAAVGGLERVVQGLAVGQRDRGWDVHVAAVVSSSDHPFLDPLRKGDVPLHTLLVESGGFLKERRFIGGLLDELRPRVVHTHGYRPDLLDAPLARKRSLATVTTEHGSSKMGGKAAVYEWVQSRRRKRFDAVVAVSSPIAARLEEKERVPADRIHLIPNAWPDQVDFLSRREARARLGTDEDELLVGWVGRMIEAKGPDVMAAAVPHIDSRASVVFIGDGPLMGLVEDTLARHGEGERVRLAGHMDEAAPLFPAFDLFALSSRTEGTPVVLLEAMAAEVPVVATRVGGVPDMLSESEARLVEPEDPEALAEAVSAALQDLDEMRDRAARARDRLDRELNGEVWLDRHERAYRAAIRVAGGA